MKKFHFYLVNTRPEDILCGDGLGNDIRNGLLRWNKKETSHHSNVVKVTFRLSQEPLRSIVRATIQGSIDLHDRETYSPKRIVRAIERSDCCGEVSGDSFMKDGRWFARAKVEKVEKV